MAFDVNEPIEWQDAEAAYRDDRDTEAESSPVQPGEYIARVAKLTLRKAKSSGFPVLSADFRILRSVGGAEDPSTYLGRAVFETLNLKARAGSEFALARTRQLEAAVGFVGEAKAAGGLRDFVETARDSLVQITTTIEKDLEGCDRARIRQICGAAAEDAGSDPGVGDDEAPF